MNKNLIILIADLYLTMHLVLYHVCYVIIYSTRPSILATNYCSTSSALRYTSSSQLVQLTLYCQVEISYDDWSLYTHTRLVYYEVPIYYNLNLYTLVTFTADSILFQVTVLAPVVLFNSKL